MAYLITYHPCRHDHLTTSQPPSQTEWITPKGWSAERAKTTFELRHPGVTVLRCDPIPQDANALPAT
jgi:hypothetical protein